MAMASPGGIVPMAGVIQSREVDFSKQIDTSNLKDKTILITGGASGLGAGLLRAWAIHDAVVIIGDINETAGVELIAEVRRSTGNDRLHFLSLDVTKWESQVAFFREACSLSPHGGIDCVVANAGITGKRDEDLFINPPDYHAMSSPPPPVLKVLDINLIGVMYTTTLATSYLSRNPGSERCSIDAATGPRDRHLILMSSIAGLMPLPGQSIYCTSKHAVVGLFRALRITAPISHGIRVNMINPYFVITPILGVAGAALMAGGGVAKVQGVVDATTRLLTDQGIIGRGLAIGPKVNANEANSAGLDMRDATHGGQEAWDVYAHDFEQSDVFIRRVVGVTNIVANQRGWSGLIQDLGGAFISPIKAWLGL